MRLGQYRFRAHEHLVGLKAQTGLLEILQHAHVHETGTDPTAIRQPFVLHTNGISILVWAPLLYNRDDIQPTETSTSPPPDRLTQRDIYTN